VIAGGGLVGASLACALAAHGGRMAVLESAPANAALPPAYDGRALALALGSQRLLERCGAWSTALGTPIQRIDIVQRGFPGRTRLDADQERVPALGQVVTAHDLGTALYARLAACGVAVLRATRVTRVAHRRGSVRVDIETATGHQQLTARLAVAADGARSTLREQAGIGAQHFDYHQHALVARVVPGLAHANTAYECFTPTGPLAMLPLPAACALIWSVAPQVSERLMALDSMTFLAELQTAFGTALGRLRQAAQRRAYPLHGLRVERLFRDRVVLVGNAAHTLHPIAGQGLNLGLRDTARLAVLLDEALRHGDDPGDSRRLAVYARERRREHDRAFAFTDGLLALFAGRALPWRLARALGLAGFDQLSPLKRLLATETMGLAGRTATMRDRP
jgi:2-octaprenyl-6-methoxyphenol hydroxylase